MKSSLSSKNHVLIFAWITLSILFYGPNIVDAEIHYYVNAATGDNIAGDGSQANPWMNISYALAQVTGPSVFIHVASGTYDTVMNGTWREIFPLNLKEGVSLIGENQFTTIIDAKETAPVFIGDNISNQTTISNFTIRNGKSVEFGMNSGAEGNITIDDCEIIIRNNVIENGQAYFGGAGIKILGGSPQIIGNIFKNNKCASYGGVINIDDSNNFSDEKKSLYINGNLFINNQGGGTNYDGAAISITRLFMRINSLSILISNNVIYQTQGHGISLKSFSSLGSSRNNEALIVNNTIIGSTNSGILIKGMEESEVRIKNNIIADNQGYGIKESPIFSGDNSDPKVEYNLFNNNELGHYLDNGEATYNNVMLINAYIQKCNNNIENDPMLINPLSYDFHLKSNSPAIDSGTDRDAPIYDFDGNSRPAGIGYDIGAYEYLVVPTYGERTTLYALFNPSISKHYLTFDEEEKNNAINNFGYQYPTIIGYVNSFQEFNTVPLYRLFSPHSVNFYLTTSDEEKNEAINIFDYQYPTVLGYIYSSKEPNTVPLYRLFSPYSINFYYTTSDNEKNTAMISFGYQYPTIIGYLISP